MVSSSAWMRASRGTTAAYAVENRASSPPFSS
jgi:ABC-type cobalamin/Fe3+-siderophores transport system ATPase subunit